MISETLTVKMRMTSKAHFLNMRRKHLEASYKQTPSSHGFEALPARSPLSRAGSKVCVFKFSGKKDMP